MIQIVANPNASFGMKSCQVIWRFSFDHGVIRVGMIRGLRCPGQTGETHEHPAGNAANCEEPVVAVSTELSGRRCQQFRKPALVCFPSFFPPAGLGTYGRFAPCFDGERDVFEIRYPGLEEGEHVPESWDTLVAMHAEAIRSRFAGRPVVLVGHSIGGCTAQAVARKLIDAGHPPAGLVLGDTYQITEGSRTQGWMLNLPVSRVSRAGDQFEALVGDTPLASMGAYNRMLAQSWHVEPLRIPTLLVRATTPMPDMLDGDPDREWRSSWPQPHDTVDVPGNHQELAYEEVDAFTAAIRAWIAARC